ncbi:heat stress transcription factor A-6b-like isoform X2 [Trifolium pratense]|uniref:Uncharacterized protein n=1 Tax=Trifolium pratense TaxID=57577 RepID=A0ACB0IMA5_TRIPR|nr:heat stress transcription factor A-6b-like isoform X2 [Trifolium pratense]CAJ2633058.1 unnamed protein product [Trifolium pratense]
MVFQCLKWFLLFMYFGDSLVDVGNNNYLTLSIAKANHRHYGIDFLDHKPTGRFSNGKNAADFIGEKLGLATSPPYLFLTSKANKNEKNVSFINGVSFASAGAGIFDGTDERYGFRKIDPDKWEFANEGFLRGYKHLLSNIKRRRQTSSQPSTSQTHSQGHCVEVGRFGLDEEIDHLRRDKQVLMMELVKLRQQQQNTRSLLQAMEERLRGTEIKQQQMMAFLARAMKNPAFIQQLLQHKEKRKEIEEAITKKRRRPIEYGESSNDVKYGFEVSELEVLAMEMQGLGRGFAAVDWTRTSDS